MVVESGCISIKDLQFDCIIGTLPYEREAVQPVILNVNLWLDFTAAARNDDLAHSIDYAQLAEHLQAFIKENRFQLVETLVLETAKFILDHYPKTQTAQVSVCKPNAIPQSKGAMASIKVTR